MQKTAAFYKNQAIYCAAAVPLGAAAGALCALFGAVLLQITAFRSGHTLALLPFLGLAGVVIVWTYRCWGKESAKGMALLFEVHQGKRESVPLRLIPLVIGGTWLTHLFGGSAGREGVAVQIGGALGNCAGNRLKVPEGSRILMIAGMAAGFGGLFRTPLAAAFFALEVLYRGKIEYEAMLPSLAAAFAANHVSGVLGLEKFTQAVSPLETLPFAVVWKLAAMGVFFGLVGMLFSVLLQKGKGLAGRIRNDFVRILAFGTAIGLISLCFGGRYAGLGTNLIAEGFSGGIRPWDFLLKTLFTALTLAAGFCGGEVTPLFSIGVSAGYVAAAVLGLPAELCAACGYAAVFGSATNTFFAPVFIGAEVFGVPSLPVFAIVCAIAYICNGGKTIYSLQK